MNKLQEQFEQELAYQEIKSNKYTLKGFTLVILVMGLIWLLTIVGIFQVDHVLVGMAFIVNLILLMIATKIGNKRNLAEPWIKYVFLAFICIGSAVIASFLSFHATFAFVLPLLFAVQYRRKAPIWFAYVVNMLTMLVSFFISFYYGICDLNLLFQSQHTRQWYLDMAATGVWNLPFNENPVFLILVFGVFPRCIIFFLFSVIMEYVVVNSNEDARRISKLTYLKETDIGTGVFNNNKFQEMAAGYYPKVKQIAVLFWDLNNLKMINDRFGHAMGDKAIQTLSSILRVYVDDRCRVYRIGGDEFLMIIDNPDPDEAKQRIASVKAELEAENSKMDEIQISSAAGYASGAGRNISDIVKAADENMYADKKTTEHAV